MRHAFPATACLLWFAAGAAHAGTAKTPELSSHECGLSTSYNVQVDDAGIWLHRRDGIPKEIFFHDGALRVDRLAQAVGTADAQRLRQMEGDARALMPEAAGIARESVDITFDALAGVVRTMTGSKRKARKIERYRERAIGHIGDSLGAGRWDQSAFDQTFEADVEAVADEVAHSVGRSALWAVFTGRGHRLDERADRVDQEVDKLVDARSAALESHARTLCTRVAALRKLQDALEYRYRGAPLVMLEPSPAPAASATATAGAGVADTGNAK
ncbi:MAG: DUF2884 family protein [Rhodanobacter sp.]